MDLFLFLDYDGTLTPIADSPRRVVISSETKCLLKRLSKNPSFKLAIISGRKLSDVRKIVGIKDIIYVGNHGLEVEGPNVKFKTPLPKSYKLILKDLTNQLNKKLSPIKGIFIENKGLSISLHFRNVDKKQIKFVKEIFNDTVYEYLSKNKIKIKTGKMVFEVMPPLEQDKGRVVLQLLEREREINKTKIFPIYIGDDTTDEDAFRAIGNFGLTIFVGKPKKSFAKYYLKDSNEVIKFLTQILG